MKNVDKKTVQDFGEEWEKFNQSEISDTELKKSWDQYFNIFPFDELSDDSEGFDMGCGSGRWARFVAKKGYKINCIDASSKALSVAKKNLSGLGNIKFYNASVNDRVLDEGSQDFGYCLGVLHHIPDTLEGLKACANLLKKDAPFLLYLYYDFENRSYFFKLAWKLSDALRKIISSLPIINLKKNIEVIQGNWHSKTLNDKEMRDLYCNSEFIIIPLKQTLQPSGQSTCLQAMSCSKAVVLTKVQGIWDESLMKHKENIFFIRSGNQLDLKNSVKTLVNDIDLRESLGKGGRHLVSSKFNSLKMCNHLKNYLFGISN